MIQPVPYSKPIGYHPKRPVDPREIAARRERHAYVAHGSKSAVVDTCAACRDLQRQIEEARGIDAKV